MTQIEDGFEDQMVMKPPAFIPYKPDGRNLPQRQADRWKRIQPLHSAPVHGTSDLESADFRACANYGPIYR
jgi:hypothetical protein